MRIHVSARSALAAVALLVLAVGVGLADHRRFTSLGDTVTVDGGGGIFFDARQDFFSMDFGFCRLGLASGDVFFLAGGGLAYGVAPETTFGSGFGGGHRGAGLPADVFAPDADADQRTVAVARENPAWRVSGARPLGLVAVRETFAFATPPDDRYVILKYTLANPTGADVSGLYVGEGVENDIIPTFYKTPGYLNDVVRFDAARDLAIVTSGATLLDHPSTPEDETGIDDVVAAAGHVLLSHPVTSYRPWVYFAGGSTPVFPAPDDAAGQFDFLSGGIVHPDPAGPDDIGHMLATGPLDVPAGAAVAVAFALICGTTTADIEDGADAARAKWAALPQAARDPLPVLSVEVEIEPDPFDPDARGVFFVTLGFDSEVEARNFEPDVTFCGGAQAIRADPSVGRRRVTAFFRTIDFDRTIRNGEPVVVAGRLADGTLFAGSDTPAIRQTLTPVTRATVRRDIVSFDGAPTWSPDGRFIAFASNRGGSFAIWRMEVAAGEASALQLTPGDGGDSDPDWSPDGATIAFARAGGIFTVPADVTATAAAGDLTQLTATSGESGGARFDREPRWSPDGGTIAFARQAFTIGPAGRHIWVMDAAGEMIAAPVGVTAVATGGQADLFFDWAPDGRTIYFTSNGRPDDGVFGIFAIDVAAGEPAVRVTPIEGIQNRHPAVSPDGRTLAFISANATGTEIVLQDLLTGRHTSLLPSVPGAPGLGIFQNLEFSPEGARLLFQAGGEIRIAHLTSGEQPSGGGGGGGCAAGPARAAARHAAAAWLPLAAMLAALLGRRRARRAALRPGR